MILKNEIQNSISIFKFEILILKNDFYLVKKDNDVIDTKITKYSTDGAVNGSIVGKVEVLLNGEVLGSRNLYFEKESVEIPNKYKK